MKEALEREVKLSPGDGFVLPELGGELQPTRRFTSTYHDTADLALARHGVTLRHRVEGGAGVWQLKLPRGAARAELEQAGPPARPPLELSALLVAFLRGRDLEPVVRLRTSRFRELEVELVGGDERTLQRLAKELRRAGATTTGELRPKLYRALGLPAPVEAAQIPAGTPPVPALGLAMAEQARRLLLHDPGVRLGSDSEELHQLRVATRRLRAFLRAGRPLLEPSWSEPLRDELRWLGAALGPARDLDVLIARIEDDVAGVGGEEAFAGLLGALQAERAEARGVVVEALSSDRYLALLDRLEHVAEPEASGSRRTLRNVWSAEWKRTRKAFARLDEASPDDELHAGRIRVKRARYAAELAAHELGKPSRPFIRAAKELQDVLGEHQDAVVAENRIRAWGGKDVESGAPARLVEAERERRASARARWPEAWDALRRAAKQLR
jgi:CHAD domain-containing protein